jgi:hypothetical protein
MATRRVASGDVEVSLRSLLPTAPVRAALPVARRESPAPTQKHPAQGTYFQILRQNPTRPGAKLLDTPCRANFGVSGTKQTIGTLTK